MGALSYMLVILGFVFGVSGCDSSSQDPDFEKDSIGGDSNPSKAGQGETGSGGFVDTNSSTGINNISGTENIAEETGLNQSESDGQGGDGDSDESETDTQAGAGGPGESGTYAQAGAGGFGTSGTVAQGGDGGFGESGAVAAGGQGGTGGNDSDGGVDAGEVDCSNQPCYDFIECMAIGMLGCGFTECVYLHPNTPFPFLGMCK